MYHSPSTRHVYCLQIWSTWLLDVQVMKLAQGSVEFQPQHKRKPWNQLSFRLESTDFNHVRLWLHSNPIGMSRLILFVLFESFESFESHLIHTFRGANSAWQGVVRHDIMKSLCAVEWQIGLSTDWLSDLSGLMPCIPTYAKATCFRYYLAAWPGSLRWSAMVNLWSSWALRRRQLTSLQSCVWFEGVQLWEVSRAEYVSTLLFWKLRLSTIAIN